MNTFQHQARLAAYVGISLVLLSSCTAPQRPTYTDPFANLESGGHNTSPNGLTVALVPSENTKNSIPYLGQFYENGRAKVLDKTKYYDPQKPFNDVIAIFRRKFKSVIKVDSLADAKGSGADLVAVVDMVFMLPARFGPNSRIDGVTLKAALLTLDGQLIDTIVGEGQGGSMGFNSGLDVVLENAIQQSQAQFAAGLVGSEKLASLASEVSGSGKSATSGLYRPADVASINP